MRALTIVISRIALDDGRCALTKVISRIALHDGNPSREL